MTALQVSPSLWLIAANVPLDTYGSRPLEKSLNDLDWVGTVALAHEAVVEHFSSRRGLTVIPMKLFTMFSTNARAVEDVARRKPAIERAMDRIEGSEEWGVRVVRAAKRNAAAATRGAVVESGTAFLAGRKRARDTARHARMAAGAAAVEVFGRLSKLARESRRREDVASSGVTPPLLVAAFLVPVTRRASFTEAARRQAAACARAGAHMTLTGPWPPYNFVADEQPS